MKSLFLAALAVLSLNVFAAEEGKNYRISNPSGKTAEPTVYEVFSYACPACYGLEPTVKDWEHKKKPANVKFVRMPASGMNPQWDMYAKIYFTAEALNILDKSHDATFKRHHVERKPISNENDAAEFLAQFGPKKETVLSTMKSFTVSTKMAQSKAFSMRHQLRSVPSFVVNDKYFTDVNMAGGVEQWAALLNELALK